MSSVQSIRVGYPHILNLPSCHTPWQGEDSCCSVGYSHILNLPLCHTDSTTTRAYPHIVKSPLRHIPVSLPSFPRPSAPSFLRPSAPSFPRPSRHSRVGGNLDARSTNHSTNASSNLARARVFP